jgi:starch synthase
MQRMGKFMLFHRSIVGGGHKLQELVLEAHERFLYCLTMKIVFASSEIVPFASTGGLGDVAAALPKTLAKQGVDVIRVMPLYASIDRKKFKLEPCDIELHVPLGHAWFIGTVWLQQFEGVTTYFIHSEEFFERQGIYGSGGHGYADNFERFLFFQKAVVKLIDEGVLEPDVVHCNDWQTALIPMFLHYGIDGSFRGGTEKTLFTIHNLAHQGWAPEERFYMTALPDHCYTMHTLEFYGELNSLKGGLVASTAINAVSPTYAREIQTRLFGCRLEGVLRERNKVLHGILNGIDYTRWNPETDAYLPANYSADDLTGKAKCKQVLQEKAGFVPDPAVPLLGVITRLVPQKGIDLLVGAIEHIIETGAQVVLLGTGDEHYEKNCREWAECWPDQMCSWIEFSTEKAHQIEAAVDIFLMPSEFEPCGQNQLYSMRYGTLPLVHSVGGLADTVIDADEKGGTGFKFNGYTPDLFFSCVERALKLFRNSQKWTAMMQRAMKQDFSVVHMGRDYIALYESILSGNETVD